MKRHKLKIGVCLLLFFLCTSSANAQDDLNILTDFEGVTKDTLSASDTYFIFNDLLTRLKIAKASSTDHCSNYSIIHEVYAKTGSSYSLIRHTTILMYSKCTNLWNEAGSYCLSVTHLRLKRRQASIRIKDSNKNTLKVKLEVDNDFEKSLKERLDRFIIKSECNGVAIE